MPCPQKQEKEKKRKPNPFAPKKCEDSGETKAAAESKKSKIPASASAGCDRKKKPEKPVRAHPKRMCVRKSQAEIEAEALKRVNSRELRGGQLLADCDCYHRNGLQHDCPRERCASSASRDKCLTVPWPECDMGRYYLDKWARYDKRRMRKPEPPYCVPFEMDLTRRYLEDEKCEGKN